MDLTTLANHLSLPDGELDQNEIQNLLDPSYIGKQTLGVIRSVSIKSSNALYIEISNNIVGQVCIFDGIIPLNQLKNGGNSDLDILNNLENHFSIGSVLKVWIKTIMPKSVNPPKNTKNKEELQVVELTLFDPKELQTLEKSDIIKIKSPSSKNDTNIKTYEIGQIVICKIFKIIKKGVKVQFGLNDFGLVDITEIYDEYYAYPLKKIESKLNTFVIGRIIAFSEASESADNEKKAPSNDIFISLRESLLIDENWIAISNEGTTVKFKKLLGYQEANGDLRSRVYKLGVPSLRQNMLFVGYVNEANDKGCFLKLSFNSTARAPTKELKLESTIIASTYFPNRLIIGN